MSFLACALAAGAALHAATAAAQNPRRTLAAAVDAAWQRALASAESDGELRRAAAERLVAAAPWAAPPSIELGHRDDRWQSDRGVRESELAVVMPVWLPGQRDAYRDAAEARAGQAEALARAGRLQIAGLVRAAVGELALLRGEVALAETQSNALGRLARDVERRVDAGDLAAIDALAARAEQLAAEAELARSIERLQAGRLRWTTLTGLDAAPEPDDPSGQAFPDDDRANSADPANGTDHADRGDGARRPPSASHGVQAASASRIDRRDRVDAAPMLPADHPTLQAAAARVESARRQLALAQASRRDPPEFVARWRRDSAGRSEPTTHSLGLAIRVPFGTDDRNAPRLAAAHGEQAIALAAERRLRDELQAELQMAHAAAVLAARLLDTERERASRLHERAALIETAFRAGESSLAETLRAVTAAAQAEAGVQRQTAALGLARARVQHALGMLP